MEPSGSRTRDLRRSAGRRHIDGWRRAEVPTDPPTEALTALPSSSPRFTHVLRGLHRRLIAAWESPSMRRPAATAATAATVVALSLASTAAGSGSGLHGRTPPFPNLPGAWSHAEINVTIMH